MCALIGSGNDNVSQTTCHMDHVHHHILSLLRYLCPLPLTALFLQTKTLHTKTNGITNIIATLIQKEVIYTFQLNVVRQHSCFLSWLERQVSVFQWVSIVSPIKHQNSNSKYTMTPLHIPYNSPFTNHANL